MRIEDGENINYNLMLFDASGRLIKNSSTQPGVKMQEVLFDLEGKSKGVYYLYVSDGKNVLSKKFVVQ